jgi:transposase InsO family protein
VRFVEEHRAVFGVEPICRVINLPVSTFYDRWGRAPSARSVADGELCARIEGIWRASAQTYGVPRVHAQLAREGVYVGRKRIERLMRRNGWRGAYLRRGWKTTTRRAAAPIPAVPDLVRRNFTADRPDRLWLADITYVRTWQGFFYLAMLLDAFSRRVVGWMMSERLHTDLVLGALEMAIYRRDTANGLIHHSDHGCQYTAFAFSRRLVDTGITASLGSVGDSFDNAMAESWFGTIKIELLYRHVWRSRHDAELAIFRWVEGWYNPRRIQRALGWRSPAEYEAAFHAGADLAVPATAKPAPVLTGVKAKPFGWPAASLDTGSGPAPSKSGGNDSKNASTTVEVTVGAN